MRNLGILWILYGILRFVAAIGVFLYGATLTVMWGALLTRVPNPFTLMDLFHLFLIFVIILGVVAGIVSVIAGLALMSGGQSARRLGLLAAFLAVITVPSELPSVRTHLSFWFLRIQEAPSRYFPVFTRTTQLDIP
jgi:hypothetical protein